MQETILAIFAALFLLGVMIAAEPLPVKPTPIIRSSSWIPYADRVYPVRENCSADLPVRPNSLTCAEQLLMCTCKHQGTSCNWNWICIE